MTEVFQLHPEPGQYAFTFGGHEPLLTVPPGSVVELTTEDCYGGAVRTVDDLPSVVCKFPFLNPVTGPIAVEGAEPGDILAVHLAEVRPRRDWAVSSTFPHFGALTTTHTTAMLHDALEERVWIYEVDVEAGMCRFSARNSHYVVDLPLNPFHGTIGVAPDAFERIVTVTPSFHGGNMDTPETRTGNTVYFPVFVDGAHLSLGDGHCRQGEGEVCGTAVEAAMSTTIVIDLIKGSDPIATPRIEDDEFIMTTGSVKPLEDAFRLSQTEMVRWTQSLTGMDSLDAYQLVSQAGLAPAGNVVDTNYTMVAKLPKSVLLGASVYDDVHNRLKRTGEDHLQTR